MSLPYPERYYGGPFARVSDPDRDMPRRESESPLSPETRERVERSGRMHGERVIAPFQDANSMEEILGRIALASGYPAHWSEEERWSFPTIQGELAEVMDRVREKASRSRGARRAWLLEANAVLERAADAYAAGEYEDGKALLDAAEDLLRGANRVRKSRSAIELGPGEPPTS